MPTYEYVCDACGHEFEEFQSITAKPLKKCPACGKTKLQRLIGIGAGVIFKGSGFYQTDYRSDSYKKAADAEKSSASSSATSTSSTATPAGDAKKTDSTAKHEPAAKSDSAAKSAARKSKKPEKAA